MTQAVDTLTSMDPVQTTPASLATELAIDAKEIRHWLRQQGWRPEVEKGQLWQLTREQSNSVRSHFGSAAHSEPPIFDPKEFAVGELLQAYASILRELRRRGLVRTNNAPIGDLAEYACLLVYGGELAPNSEKSYDIAAADGRRIQVKVRNIRDDTRASSVFSPLRSFGFDACVFLLVDDLRGSVIAAYEWSNADVQAHGKHREHTNGTVVRVRQVRAGNIGADLTDELQRAWATMLAIVA